MEGDYFQIIHERPTTFLEWQAQTRE